jgi:hypothetical protein
MPGKILFALVIAFLLAALGACTHPDPTHHDGQAPLPQFSDAETPEHLLIAALEELDFIADWQGPVGDFAGGLARTSTDSTFIYGETVSGGYGAVVTERHTYPKGLLLITIRKTYGREEGRIVSESKTYISFQSLIDGNPETSLTTELYALSGDTIVTHVTRNGTQETYTFRLPVITSTLAASPEESRVVLRHGRARRIVVETRDGNGALIQERASWGESDGSLYALTSYPDGSWRRSRTLGSANGSILRETHTGTGAP